MMHRQKLIGEVKAEYARLADIESRDAFLDAAGAQPPEAYYETLLGEVLTAIEDGRFDGFSSGREIVEAVANDHARWGVSM